jgi:hypothetical protein
MSKKMQFKLLFGTYRVGDMVFKPGQIVTSDRDLKKTWPSKFERVEGLIDADDEDVRAIIEAEDDELDEESITLAAKHKGGARWVVFNTETGESVHDGYLTREQADELVEGGVEALPDILEAMPKEPKKPKKKVKAKRKKKS